MLTRKHEVTWIWHATFDRAFKLIISACLASFFTILKWTVNGELYRERIIYILCLLLLQRGIRGRQNWEHQADPPVPGRGQRWALPAAGQATDTWVQPHTGRYDKHRLDVCLGQWRPTQASAPPPSSVWKRQNHPQRQLQSLREVFGDLLQSKWDDPRRSRGAISPGKVSRLLSGDPHH